MTFHLSLGRALFTLSFVLCIQGCSGGGSDHGRDEDPIGSNDGSVPCEGPTCAPAEDAAPPGDDGAAPGSDAAAPDGDAALPDDDAASPDGDAALQGDDAATQGDAGAEDADAATTDGDAATSGGDAATSDDDAATPDDDAATPSSDAGTSDEDAATTEDDGATDACVDGTTESTSCGLNLRGQQIRTCEQGAWSAWSACSDPDTCVDGSTRAGSSCGLNGRGLREEICVLGQFVAGQCSDSDECVDGAAEVVSCGSDGSASQARQCVTGQWESGPCTCADGQVMTCEQRCVARQPRVFVRPKMEGCQDGLSWATAATSIANALEAVADGGEVSVGGGTYTLGDTEGLRVVRPVALRGGYAGDGEQPDARDWAAYPSELTRVPTSMPEASVPPLLTFEVAEASHVEGMVFRDGHATESSGAILVEHGELTVRSSVFRDNSGNEGGAVRGDPLGDRLHIVDSVFTNNSASEHGGAVNWVERVERCRFVGNRAGGSGGAVMFARLVSSSSFEGNRAHEGGALANATQVDDSYFASNLASLQGGAMVSSLPVLVQRSEFVKNRADEGGAIALNHAEAKLTLLSSTLVENVATGLFGGALSIHDGALELINDLFAKNQVLGADTFGTGGALFFSSQAEARLTHCTFANNRAPREGGALTVTAEWENGKPPPRLDVQIVNSLFVDNQAQSHLHIYDAHHESEVSGSSLAGQAWTGPGAYNIHARAELDDSFYALASSPTVDAALPELLPRDEFDLDGDGDHDEPLPLDLDGLTRSVRAPDMGCYERP